jgi:replicative DNA helicase
MATSKDQEKETLLQEAQRLREAGFCVIPVRSRDFGGENGRPLRGRKSPTLGSLKDADGRNPGEDSYKGALPTAESVAEAFSHPEAGGIGIQCGYCSGSLEVLDIDTKYDETGTLWEEFQDLLREHFPETFPTVRTPSGGAHVYYRAEKPPEESANVELAYEKTGKNATIETRTQGGYIVAPPTPGYTMERGSLDKIPTLSKDERRLLHALAKSFDLTPPKETPAEKAYTKTEGKLPGTDYNERGDVLRLLYARGWTVTDTGGDRVNLTHPHGKNATSGNYRRSTNTVYIFSTSTDLPANEGLSPFAVYAHLEHGGDFTSAAQELRRSHHYGETSRGTLQTVKAQTHGLEIEFTRNDGETCTLPAGEPLTVDIVRYVKAKSWKVKILEGADYDEVAEVLKILCREETSTPSVHVEEGASTLSGTSFLYDLIRREYEEIAERKGHLTDPERDAMLSRLVETGATFDKSPIAKDLYIRCFKEDEDLHSVFGVSPESWEETINKLHREQSALEERETLSLTLAKAQTLHEQGKHTQAVEILTDGLETVKRSEAGRSSLRVVTFEDAINELQGTPPGLRPGYAALNPFVTFQSGAVSLIAGRPSHGKTSLLLNLLLNISKTEEGCAYFFTYEEPAKFLHVKLLNILTDKNLERYAIPGFSTMNYPILRRHFQQPAGERDRALEEEISEARETLADLERSGKLALVDAHRLSAEDLERHLLRLNGERAISAVFIDYVQSIGTEEKKQDKRNEVGHVSKVLLRTAIETELPFIVGAQLNRTTAKRPTLEGLKEAGNLEEDANTVLSIFNPQREEDENGQRHTGELVGLEMKTLKNREGEVNRQETLYLHTNTQRITDGGETRGNPLDTLPERR